MNRLLLLLLLCAASPLMAQQSSNTILDVPASYNEVLLERSITQNAHRAQVVRSLLGKSTSNAKNNTEGLQDVIHVQSGKTFEVCLDTFDISGSFASLNDLACATLSFGTVNITDNCFAITAGAGIIVGRDTLCLELCDDNGDCTSFIYPIEVRNPVSIPFFEDWSNPKVVPDGTKWQNADVFVNGTIGIDPPTYGIATFDGIDKNGRPYGGGEGASDQLTSAFIDLNAFSAASDVYFGYWVQPQGYGDRPEEIDSLVLEFKQEDGTWEIQAVFAGVPSDSTSMAQFPFTHHSIQLNDDKYFHDGFQFRFTNYSSNKGAVDNWHVDYITLNENSSSATAVDDLGFVDLPNSLLKTYTAMPWKHFIEAPDLLRDSFKVVLSNLSDMPFDAQPRRLGIFNAKTNAPVHIGDDILDSGQRIIPANSKVNITNPITNFATYQSAVLQSMGNGDTLCFESFLSIDPSFENGAILQNNSVVRTTVFDNYFAYDDGSAETNIVAQNNSTQFAVEFDTYAEDSLRAVALSFIEVSGLDITRELFHLRVYFDDLNSDPVLENLLLKPILTNTLFDTIQSFSTYALEDPTTGNKQALYVPANTKVFIAYQTASANPIPIGFDRNSPEAAGKNHLGLSGGWFPFPDSHQGAVLLRPIFGNETPATTSTSDPIAAATDVMQIFPNPSQGVLHFISDDSPLSNMEYTAYNTLGQIIQRGRLTSEVDFSNQVDGVYYLQIVERDSQKIYNHKFILSR